MPQPADFNPHQPPPVQQPPQEVDFSNLTPPPQGEQARPTTVYMPQAALSAAPVKKPFNPLAFLIGLLGIAILGVGSMLPMVTLTQELPADDKEPIIAAMKRSEMAKVLFTAMGPHFEVCFDPMNWFMWAALIMAAVTFWLTLIRSWAGYWIIGLGTIATVVALYFLRLFPQKMLPGTGMYALALGGLLLIFAALVGGRSNKANRYQY
jgi:hypothetical protein